MKLPSPLAPAVHQTIALRFAVFFVSRRAGAVVLGLALAIGLSRIAVGLHYPSDIAAGAVVGFVAAAAAHSFARRPLVGVALLLSRLTDPSVFFVWAALSRLQAGSGSSRPPGGSSSSSDRAPARELDERLRRSREGASR
jgi:PAP2 superfamily